MSNPINLKGLGKKQREVILRMVNENLQIRDVHDFRDMSVSRSLCDEDNDYEYLSYQFIDSLGKRNLFKTVDFSRCLVINIITLTLKPLVIEKVKQLNIIGRWN